MELGVTFQKQVVELKGDKDYAVWVSLWINDLKWLSLKFYQLTLSGSEHVLRKRERMSSA